MRPSAGDVICGRVRIDGEADSDMGGHAFGPVLRGRVTDEAMDVWLTVVERGFVPSQVDVSRFMAGAGALPSLDHPTLVRVGLVDREADFCVIGHQALPGSVSLARRLEGAGTTAGLVDRVAVEVARGLGFLHKRDIVHGALSPGNIVLWEHGVALWQYGLSQLCVPQALAPRFRALGGDVVAPEVREGQPVSPAADVYAWGAVVASLSTDCFGSAALAAVEDGELDAGPLTSIIKAALSADPAERPADGAEILRRIQSGPSGDLVNPSGLAKQAELRELAGRYLDEVEGRAPKAPKPGRKARRFKRVAKEAYSPEQAPISGVLEASDEPEPDPFTLPPGSVTAAPDVEEEVVPAPPRPAAEPAQITARRIEDEPVKRFNPDALTPPDGAVLADLEPPPPRTPTSPVVIPALAAPGIDGASSVPRTIPPDPTPVPVSVLTPPSASPTVPRGAPPVIGRIETKQIPVPRTPAPPLASPLPPPPAHDDLPPGDSGFGLSLPTVEALDAMPRAASGSLGAGTGGGSVSDAAPDPVADVVGALALAESSPRLETIDGERADSASLRADEPALSLDTRRRKPTPAGSNAPPSRGAGRGRRDSPRVEAPRLDFDHVPSLSARSSASMARGPATATAAPVVMRGGSRGPRGAMMAGALGLAATILAVGVTLPVAAKHGGLAALLGISAPAVAPSETAAPPPSDPKPPAPPAAPAGPVSCPKDTAAIPGRDGVCIETGEYPGLRQIPTTSVTLADAVKACEDGGRRLCAAREWKQACRGKRARRNPYVGPRVDGQCNDAGPSGVGQNLSRSGAREGCVTPEGVFDLVGNVGEWVASGAVLGGDATTARASCATQRKPAKASTHPATGFRCCVDLDDPAG